MKTTNFVLIVGLASVLLFNACSKKTIDMPDHEVENSYMDKQVQIEEKLPEEIQGLKSFDNKISTYNQKLQDPSYARFKEIINPLKSYYFSTDMISNTDFTNQAIFHEIFNLFSRAILIETQNGTHLELLSQYHQVLLDACADDITNCHALEFYKRSPFAYKVLKILLDKKMKNAQSIKSSKGVVSIEYIGSFNETLELVYICRYIKHQNDNHLDEITIRLMNDYQTLEHSKNAKLISKKFQIRLVKIAKLLFGWFDTQDKDMLKNAFKLSQIDSKISDYQFAGKSYLLLASKVMLTDPEQSKSLFKEELDLIKASSTNKKGSYFFISDKIELARKLIKKDKSDKEDEDKLKEKLSLLNGLDPSFSFNAEDTIVLNNNLIKNYNPIYLFLIDRLYENHFSLDDVNVIWGNYIKSIKDKKEVEKEFLTVVRHYLQTMIFYKVITSHNELKKKFHEYDGAKENKLKNVLTHSNFYFKDWEETLERVNGIKGFIQTHFYHGDNPAEEYTSLCNSIEVLDENIKIFSVWPLMMYFSYQFKNENTAKFTNFLNTEFSIDGLELIRMFNEVESAWIPLTADNKPISTLKTIYSMSYLFSMGLLNNDKDGSDQSVDFIVSFIKKLTLTMRNEYSKHIAQLNKFTTKSMGKYLDACNALVNMEKNQKPINVELALTDLDKSLFIGTENAGVGSAFLKFFKSTQSTQDYLESNQLIKFLKEINSLYNFQNQVITIIQNIYVATLEQKVASGLIIKSQQQDRLNEINTAIDKLTNDTTKLKNEFDKGILKLYVNMDKCMIDFLAIEDALRYDILKKIKIYFQEIYNSLNSVPPSSENTLIPVNGPEGYRGFNAMISNNNYNMHKIDIMIKLGEILENTTSIVYQGRKILINTSITPPSNFYNLDIIKKPTSNDIKPINNEETYQDFEDKVFQAMLSWSTGHGEKFINWYGETYDLDKIIQKIELSRELLKASYNQSSNISKSISADSVLKSLIKVSGYLDISKENLPLFKLFKQKTKHNQDQINKLFYKNNTLIPYAENYFHALKEELLPKTYLGTGQGTIMETIHFYKSQRDMDKFFFNIDESVSEEIKKIYQANASMKMQTLKDFMSACEKHRDELIESSHYLDSDFQNIIISQTVYNPDVFEDNISSIRKTFYEETKCYYEKTSKDINDYFKININTCENL